MAPKKPPFPVQEVLAGYEPGTYRGLGARGRATLASPQMSESLGLFESIFERAERRTRDGLKLGPYSYYRHRDMSLKWGNTFDKYAKEEFLTSPEGKKLQKLGWKFTEGGRGGADFYNRKLKAVLDPAGSSKSSVDAHRPYSRDPTLSKRRARALPKTAHGDWGVVVRTGAPTGGRTVFHSGGGRKVGGLANVLVPVVEMAKNKDKIVEDAGMGVHFLPTYRLFEGKRRSPRPLEPFDGTAARKEAVFDKRLFESTLKRLPNGTILPLEYPVERTATPWISDVSSRERINMLSKNPGEYLVWRKRANNWHMSRSKRHYERPWTPLSPRPKPTTPVRSRPFENQSHPLKGAPYLGSLPQSSLSPRKSILSPRPKPTTPVRSRPFENQSHPLKGAPYLGSLPGPILSPRKSILSPRPKPTTPVRSRPFENQSHPLKGAPYLGSLPQSILSPRKSILSPRPKPTTPVRSRPFENQSHPLKGAPYLGSLPQSILSPRKSILSPRPKPTTPVRSRPFENQSHPLKGAPYLGSLPQSILSPRKSILSPRPKPTTPVRSRPFENQSHPLKGAPYLGSLPESILSPRKSILSPRPKPTTPVRSRPFENQSHPLKGAPYL